MRMSASMKNPVLLLGGSGVVGRRVARALRRLHPELPIVLAARDVAKATAVAAQIGGPTTATRVDLAREDLGLEGASFGAVVTLLTDPWLNSLKFAQARGLAYLSFASFAFEIGPEVAHFIQNPGRAPILLLGHVFGGVGTLAALHLAREFKKVESIALAGVVDPEDQGGPASQADFERLGSAFPSALIREDGLWRWVAGEEAAREIVDVTGVKRQGGVLALLDVVSLAAATEARSIRVDFATREAVSGRGPATELIVEIAGEDHEGAAKQVRIEITDDDVYANLSAYGAALATERLLGLAGHEAPEPGLYHPESLLEPERAMQRLQELGAKIRRV
ncbi:hypothetical protein [Nannocystis bainbridge]|uniref:Saccharopine dehydrogenase n=1 Tax=Nannocystis bainbridge TaxID=2995303 RepID=A0ABT5EA14_9BACT|nr:hypothetical protein [Nannocystis bainbridge]MDC0722270.1 hypothetical protein [Nannocystis bainbridge]